MTKLEVRSGRLPLVDRDHLEIQLTTDLKTGETTGTVGLKYNF